MQDSCEKDNKNILQCRWSYNNLPPPDPFGVLNTPIWEGLINLSQVLDEMGKPKTLYVHYTNATDTKNIKHVFDDVSDIIIKNLLEKEFL